MDGQTGTVIISGVVSLTSAFGSILLKDHLDLRREERKAASAAASTPARAAEASAPPVPVAPSIWDAYVAPVPGAAATTRPGSGLPPLLPSLPPSIGANADAPKVFPGQARPVALPADPPIGSRMPRAAGSVARREAVVRAAAIIVVGLALGIITARSEFGSFIFMLGAMIFATLANLIYFIHPRNRSLLGYLLAIVSLWAAFFGGVALQTGTLSNENLTEFYAVACVFAVLGLTVFGLTFRWGRRDRR